MSYKRENNALDIWKILWKMLVLTICLEIYSFIRFIFLSQFKKNWQKLHV